MQTKFNGLIRVNLFGPSLYCQPNFRSKFLEIIITKFPQSCHFQNVVCIFCAFNIARDMWTISFEIWTKLFISPVILKAQKTQTTFWKCQGLENYVIIVSRIIHVKVDRRINVKNKFKYQRRLSSRLAMFMFRGTTCRLNLPLLKGQICVTKSNILKSFLCCYKINSFTRNL